MSLVPTTGILKTAIQSGMTHIDAVSEFVDNAFGPAAGNADEIVIVDARNGTAFIDQGRGVSDINLLFRLGDGDSRNYAGDIGKFGVGSKFGALTFGTKVTVKTVHKGVFHQHTVDWAQVMTSNRWPAGYSGKGMPVSKAPEVIRKGGTIIIVEDLHKGRSRPQDATYESRLGLRFMPALESGKEITILRSKSLKDAIAGKYTSTLSVSKYVKTELTNTFRNIERHTLDADGKSFKAMFAELPDGDKSLNGLHITFAGRVIEVMTGKVNDVRLPSRFFGRIDLSEAFKDDLSYNKTVITDGRDALFGAILAAAKDLIAKLASRDSTDAFERLSLDISNMLSAGIGNMLRPNAGGKVTSNPGNEVNVMPSRPSEPSGINPPDDPKPRPPSKPDNGAKDGDDHNRAGAFQLKIKSQDMGDAARRSTAEIVVNGAVSCTVMLNTSLPVIKYAMDNTPNNKPAVLLMCVDAMAAAIARDTSLVNVFMGQQADTIANQADLNERRDMICDVLYAAANTTNA